METIRLEPQKNEKSKANSRQRTDTRTNRWRNQRHTPIPQILKLVQQSAEIQEQIDELGKVIPQERVLKRVVEQILNAQVPQIIDEIGEVIQ